MIDESNISLKKSLFSFFGAIYIFLIIVFSYSILFIISFLLIRVNNGLLIFGVLFFLAQIFLVLLPFIRYREALSDVPMKKLIIKRIFDLNISLPIIVMLSPILILIALFIRIESPGPVFTIKKRVGLNGYEFNLLKFRTGYINTMLGEKFDPSKLTRIGALLQKTSLDEFPQYLNILVGDMSLVGPLAKSPDWKNIINPDPKRFSFPPGLTGAWQVNFRKYSNDEEMIKMDLYYINNWSVWLDTYLLGLTIPAVLIYKSAN